MQGRLDSPLTLQGIQQAQRNGRQLHGLLNGDPSYAMVASPLGRAWQTAAIIAEVSGYDPTKISHDALLTEMTWGEWDGLTGEEIEARDPELWQARIDDRWTVPPPGGGETQQDILERAQRWLSKVRDRRLIAVAHGALGRAIRCAYAGEPPSRMLELDEPQDGFFRLRNRQVERIDPLRTAEVQRTMPPN